MRIAHHTYHAYLVFDTLYGFDETFTPKPQMVEGHTVEADGKIWTLRLRDGLRFHDGTPVFARDAIASIRRFAARDPFGQSLLAATGELSAPDDRTLRFRLTRSFPHLLAALAGSSINHAGYHAGAACQHRSVPPGDGDGWQRTLPLSARQSSMPGNVRHMNGSAVICLAAEEH